MCSILLIIRTILYLRKLKELSLSKCPALKQLPNTGRCILSFIVVFLSMYSICVVYMYVCVGYIAVLLYSVDYSSQYILHYYPY